MDRYAVFGNPVKHSKSPLIHTLFARQTAQVMSYEAIAAPVDEFAASVTAFFASGGKGCNVTLPFKEEAFQFADQLTDRAQLAGAVNTLKWLDDETVLGDNTDGQGLVSDLLRHTDLRDKRILLLGAGGAARGVLGPLCEQPVKEIVIANRTHSKAVTLAARFSELGQVSAVEFDELAGPFDLIINSTSASLSNEVPSIDADLIHDDIICYDMMYGAEKTAFNLWAEQNGCKKTIDGLGMLVGQGAESFALWRGVIPEVAPALELLRASLRVA